MSRCLDNQNNELGKLLCIPCDTIVLLDSDWNGVACSQPRLHLGVNRQFANHQAQLLIKVTLDSKDNCNFELQQCVHIDCHGSFYICLPKGSVAVCIKMRIEDQCGRCALLEGLFARPICDAPFNPYPIDCHEDTFLVCSGPCEKLERKRFALVDGQPIDCENDKLLVCSEQPTPHGTAAVLVEKSLCVMSDQPLNCMEDSILVCEPDALFPDRKNLVCKKLHIDASTVPISCTEDSILVCDANGNLVAKPLDIDMNPEPLACDDLFLICSDGDATFQTREIGDVPAVACDASLIVCQQIDDGPSRIVKAPIVPATSIPCPASFVYCDPALGQNVFKQASILHVDDTPFNCTEDRLIVCKNGTLQQAEFAVNQEGSVIPCDAHLVFCDAGGNLSSGEIQADTPLDTVRCSDALIVCNEAGNLEQKQILPSPETISCQNDSFVICDVDGDLRTKSFPTATPFECTDSIVVCDNNQQLQVRTFGDATALSCQASFVVCQETGEGQSNLVLAPIAADDAALECDSAFVVCADGQLVQRLIDFAAAGPYVCDPENPDRLVVCRNGEIQGISLLPALPLPVPCNADFVFCDGETLQHGSIADDNLDLPCTANLVACVSGQLVQRRLVSEGEPVRCSDGILVCDAESGTLQVKSLSVTDATFNCKTDKFLICDDENRLQTREVGSNSTIACDACFLVCQSVTDANCPNCPPGSVSQLQLAPLGETAAIRCDAQFIVCQDGELVRASLTSVELASCDVAFVVCDSNGNLAQAPIGSAASVPCNAELLFCEEGQIATAPIGETGALLCDAQFLVCQDGELTRASIGDTILDCSEPFNLLACQQNGEGPSPLGSLPVTEGGIVSCGDAFLVCGVVEGGDSALQFKTILTGATLGCETQFLVCEGGQLAAAPLATAAQIPCFADLVFCDQEFGLQRASIGVATSFECNNDSWLICTPDQGIATLSPLSLPNGDCAESFTLFGCQIQEEGDNSSLHAFPVSSNGTQLGCADGFLVCTNDGEQTGFEIRPIGDGSCEVLDCTAASILVCNGDSISRKRFDYFVPAMCNGVLPNISTEIQTFLITLGQIPRVAGCSYKFTLSLSNGTATDTFHFNVGSILGINYLFPSNLILSSVDQAHWYVEGTVPPIAVDEEAGCDFGQLQLVVSIQASEVSEGPFDVQYGFTAQPIAPGNCTAVIFVPP